MADKIDWLAIDTAQRGVPSSEARIDAELRARARTTGNDSAQRGDKGQPGEALHYEGQWVPLADTSDANVPLTKDDLNAMVRNFQPKSVADYVPVRFGRANGEGPVVAHLSALLRDGAILSGRLGRVDPRFAQLLASKKLGGRTRKSLHFQRTPEKGASLTGYGFLPPRTYVHAGGVIDEATDDSLTKLAIADRAGKVLQFSAADAGLVEFVITENATTRRSAAQQHGHLESNSAKLNDLAVKHQRENKVSFSESLAAVVAVHPELTVPDWIQPTEQHGESFRFPKNSEQLSALATQRARRDKVSFGEALLKVAAENPRLTLPDGVISFEEETPKSNGQKLSDLAYERAREDHISFGEALSQCAVEHPELTRPDVR